MNVKYQSFAIVTFLSECENICSMLSMHDNADNKRDFFVSQLFAEAILLSNENEQTSQLGSIRTGLKIHFLLDAVELLFLILSC